MARATITVDNYSYEGTDAQRTLHNLGELWAHHVHGRTIAPDVMRRCADELVTLVAPLADDDSPELAPRERLSHLGERAAKRIDDVNPLQLERALRKMWTPLAALASAANDATTSVGGVVGGLFVSDGGVPKTPVDSVEIGYRGVIGDRQASRQHHGRPWQALCLWSAEEVADLAAAGHPIRPGSAGENISLRGVDWSLMRPGTQLRLGDVHITLTAYAIPCYKNAQWFSDGDYERMSHERGDASRLYARVDQPGRVSVGDHLRTLA